MKVIVLNGSPKGELSVTLQSIRFIEKKFKHHDFEIHHISKSIRAIGKDPKVFNKIIERIAQADLILWSTPVYVCIVPSQLMQFIEMLYDDKDVVASLKGKFSAVLTTSIHFFDHCAHRYMAAVCHDLGLNSAGEYSADSYDLLNTVEQNRLYQFAGTVFDSVMLKSPYYRPAADVEHSGFRYQPDSEENPEPVTGKVVIIADTTEKKGNTAAMVTRLKASFSTEVSVVDISRPGLLKGGCLGCVQCGFDHNCIFEGKDELIDLYEKTIRHADIIIFAAAISRRFFSVRFKRFFDRAFFNNHTPTLTGKQIGFLVSGSYLTTPYIQDFIELYAQWQGANLVDIITDEALDSEQLDKKIAQFAKHIVACHRTGYVKPPTFIGVGGMKIFRDDIWGRHRFVFQADHTYFKNNGLYDFPQNDKRIIETNEFMFKMTAEEPGRSAIRKTLAREMVRPHQKKLKNI